MSSPQNKLKPSSKTGTTLAWHFGIKDWHEWPSEVVRYGSDKFNQYMDFGLELDAMAISHIQDLTKILINLAHGTKAGVEKRKEHHRSKKGKYKRRKKRF